MPFLISAVKSNTVAVTLQLLSYLKIRVTSSEVEKTLLEHPDYPSILSISESLEGWNISSSAYKFSSGNLNVNDLNLPLIAHLEGKYSRFILIKEFRNDKLIYSDEHIIRGEMGTEQFFKYWSGVFLHASKGVSSGDPDFFKNRCVEIVNSIKLPALIAILLYIVIDLTVGRNWYINTLLVIKFLGIFVTSLLLTFQVDASNSLIQHLCTIGRKNSCNNILRSKAAKVTSWLSLSEVGFFYFSGTFLCLLTNTSFFPYSVLFSAISIPLIFYSFYYQFKYKNWCIFCCIVQFMLLTEVIVALFSDISFFDSIALLNTESIIFFSFLFIIPVLLWMVFQPIFTQSVQYNQLNIQLRRIKFDREVFNQLLIQQPKANISDNLRPIVYGSPNARLTLTMVSNLLCEPCSNAHDLVLKWIKKWKNIKVEIIFNTNLNDNDIKTKVASHLHALNLIGSGNNAEVALNEWFSDHTKNYEKWVKKHSVQDVDPVLVQKILKFQKEWCDAANIISTPTLFINGFQLPQYYKLEEIESIVFS